MHYCSLASRAPMRHHEPNKYIYIYIYRRNIWRPASPLLSRIPVPHLRQTKLHRQCAWFPASPLVLRVSVRRRATIKAYIAETLGCPPPPTGFPHLREQPCGQKMYIVETLGAPLPHCSPASPCLTFVLTTFTLPKRVVSRDPPGFPRAVLSNKFTSPRRLVSGFPLGPPRPRTPPSPQRNLHRRDAWFPAPAWSPASRCVTIVPKQFTSPRRLVPRFHVQNYTAETLRFPLPLGFASHPPASPRGKTILYRRDT